MQIEKVLICLEVPSISQTYEVYLPNFLPVKEIIPILRKIAEELSNHLYVSSGHEFLCAKRTDILLDEEAMISNYDILNGDHLILL